MATTRSRPRGRENARPPVGGVAAEHATKIYGVAVGSVVVTVAFLALTGTGHVIDAATQHFMLYYAGVFALLALCASVALGLIATDRMILRPGHRIFVQSAHRAASFGAVAFLLIHIVTEILAQRVHVLDAVVPFLSPFRTFYIGLGTIASDLIVLLVITGMWRKRFTAHGKAWRWRAIHYTSYLAFVFGVWHGLLGGRPGKPYVDWSYGFVVAAVAAGLAVRILANSLRPKENLSGPPVAESAGSGSAPMRAASMFAQLGVVRAAMSAATPSPAQGMLAAPVDAWDTGQAPALAALPASADAYENAPYESTDGRQPFYEPGYEGPPRYMGAPRGADTGPIPRAPTGPLPRAAVGQLPQEGTGPARARNSGPLPRAATGPLPRPATGPLPQMGPGAGQARNTGPLPRAATGPLPQAGNAPHLRHSGPLPRAASGPMPRAATGPMPAPVSLPPTGPMTGAGPAMRGGAARPASAARPAPPAGSMPRSAARRTATGPMPSPATGRRPAAASGPIPRAMTGPMPSTGVGASPSEVTAPQPLPGSAMPQGGGAGRRHGTRAGARGNRGQAQSGAPGAPAAPGGQGQTAPQWVGPAGRAGSPGWAAPSAESPEWSAEAGVWSWDFGQPPWEGGAPEPDPGLRYREPGPGMPGYRSGDDFYGGEGLR